MSRGANQGRKELKGWYQNKTDGGKVHRSQTFDVLVAPNEAIAEQWRKEYPSYVKVYVNKPIPTGPNVEMMWGDKTIEQAEADGDITVYDLNQEVLDDSEPYRASADECDENHVEIEYSKADVMDEQWDNQPPTKDPLHPSEYEFQPEGRVWKPTSTNDLCETVPVNQDDYDMGRKEALDQVREWFENDPTVDVRSMVNDRLFELERVTPNPGSLEAMVLGCNCPKLDNEYGDEEKTGGHWVVRLDCTLHGEEE